AFERRKAETSIITTHEAIFCRHLHHELTTLVGAHCTADRQIPVTGKPPFMILRQFVAILLGETVIQQGIGRRELYAQQLVRTTPRVNRLVKIIAAKGQLETEVGTTAVTKSRCEQRIVVQVVLRIINRIRQSKEIIRPFQLLAQSKGNT